MRTIPAHRKRVSSSQSKKRSPKNYLFNEIATISPAQDAISDVVRCRVPVIQGMTSKQRRSARRMAEHLEHKLRESF